MPDPAQTPASQPRPPQRPSADRSDRASRAEQRGRGREATKPSEPPPRRWKSILWRTLTGFGSDQIPLVAAGVSFYALLALFPALAALVAFYGLFFDVHDLQSHMAAARAFVPPVALQFIGDQLARLVRGHSNGLSLAAGFALAASIWSANGAVRSMMAGLNIAFEQRERRNFIVTTLVSLAFTLGLIVFGVVAVIALGAGPFIQEVAGQVAAQVFNVASYAVAVVVLGLGLALLYRFGPSRHPAKIQWISWGAVAAVTLWLAVSALFSVYVGNFAHYDRTYGSFGAVVAFIMWVYVSNMIVLLGAELNSQIEHP